jgi:hypothetical protein
MAVFSIWRLGATDISEYVSVGSTISFKKDQTLDDGKLVLLLTNSKPLSQEDGVLNYFDGTSTYYFDIVSDSVELVQRGSENAYAHTVQYASVSRRFAFSLAKGMDFSQPKNGGKLVSRWNGIQYAVDVGGTITTSVASFYGKGFTFYPKGTISGGKIKFSIYQFSLEGDTATRLIRSTTFVCPSATVSYFDGSSNHTLFTVNGSFSDKSEIALTASQIALLNQHKGQSVSISSVGYVTPAPLVSVVGEAVVNAQLVLDVFYYTYADVINQVIRGCNRPSDDNTAETPICQLPVAGEFHDFLISTISPNFQFTQGETLWECLVKIYDGFDAKPIVSDYSSVPTLGVSYYNERTNVIDANKFVASSSELQDENRANGLVCRYQNGTPPSPVYFPAKGKLCKARSESLGVPNNNDYRIIVGSPIQSLMEVFGGVYKIDVSGGDSSGTLILDNDVLVDLIPVIYEKSIWSSLNASTTQSLLPTQYNTMWFQSGTNSIYVGDLKTTVDGTNYNYQRAFMLAVAYMLGADGVSGTSFSMGAVYYLGNVYLTTISLDADKRPWDVSMVVAYIPKIDGCVRVEGPSDKRFGESLVNQSSALMDLSKMGANMYGLASRLGEEKRSKVYAIDTLANMPKAGSWYTDTDGSLWVVQCAKATIYDDGVKCELELAKNFNQLSRRIAVDRQVTFSGISESLTLASETIYQEYLYFITQTAFNGGKIPTRTYVHSAGVMFLMACFSSLDTQTDWSSYGVDFASFHQLTGGVYGDFCQMPIITYGAGNSLCFEGGFDSPISAGNRLKIDVTGWVSSLSSEVVAYADGYGFADFADITLCSSDSIGDYSSLPLISEPSDEEVSLRGLKIEKRPNDVFKFNYELIFLPYHANGYEDVLIYPNFSKNSQIVTRKKPNVIKVYLLPSGSIPYSSFEAKAYGTEQTPSSYFTGVISNTSSSGHLYAFNVEIKDGASFFTVPSGSWIGWMLADENDVPLIASNEALTVGQNIVFYAYGSHNRL